MNSLARAKDDAARAQCAARPRRMLDHRASKANRHRPARVIVHCLAVGRHPAMQKDVERPIPGRPIVPPPFIWPERGVPIEEQPVVAMGHDRRRMTCATRAPQDESPRDAAALRRAHAASPVVNAHPRKGWEETTTVPASVILRKERGGNDASRKRYWRPYTTSMNLALIAPKSRCSFSSPAVHREVAVWASWGVCVWLREPFLFRFVLKSNVPASSSRSPGRRRESDLPCLGACFCRCSRRPMMLPRRCRLRRAARFSRCRRDLSRTGTARSSSSNIASEVTLRPALSRPCKRGFWPRSRNGARGLCGAGKRGADPSAPFHRKPRASWRGDQGTPQSLIASFP